MLWDSDVLRKPSHVSYINVVGKRFNQDEVNTNKNILDNLDNDFIAPHWDADE